MKVFDLFLVKPVFSSFISNSLELPSMTRQSFRLFFNFFAFTKGENDMLTFFLHLKCVKTENCISNRNVIYFLLFACNRRKLERSEEVINRKKYIKIFQLILIMYEQKGHNKSWNTKPILQAKFHFCLLEFVCESEGMLFSDMCNIDIGIFFSPLFLFIHSFAVFPIAYQAINTCSLETTITETYVRNRVSHTSLNIIRMYRL